MLFQDLLQIHGRVRVFRVVPDPDVAYYGSVFGLAHVGGAGQERHGLAIRVHVEALKENVAERVVAGQVVHRFLAEHEQTVEAAPDELFRHGLATGGQLFGGEVDQEPTCRKSSLPEYLARVGVGEVVGLGHGLGDEVPAQRASPFASSSLSAAAPSMPLSAIWIR